MRTRIKRLGLLLLGWAFILLGIVGLFLPVLQGVLFIIIGLIILSSEYVWAHKLLQHLRRKCPKIARHTDEASVRASAWMRRVFRQNEPH